MQGWRAAPCARNRATSLTLPSHTGLVTASEMSRQRGARRAANGSSYVVRDTMHLCTPYNIRHLHTLARCGICWHSGGHASQMHICLTAMRNASHARQNAPEGLAQAIHVQNARKRAVTLIAGYFCPSQAHLSFYRSVRSRYVFVQICLHRQRDSLRRACSHARRIHALEETYLTNQLVTSISYVCLPIYVCHRDAAYPETPSHLPSQIVQYGLSDRHSQSRNGNATGECAYFLFLSAQRLDDPTAGTARSSSCAHAEASFGAGNATRSRAAKASSHAARRSRCSSIRSAKIESALGDSRTVGLRAECERLSRRCRSTESKGAVSCGRGAGLRSEVERSRRIVCRRGVVGRVSGTERKASVGGLGWRRAECRRSRAKSVGGRAKGARTVRIVRSSR